MYDIYFANPDLNPEVRADPADENFSIPWMLDEERGDATVEDICDFVVEYINSDVMVCPRRPAPRGPSLEFTLSAVHRDSWRTGTSPLPINQRW